MAKKIYKYSLSLEAHQEIMLPNGAKVLRFMNQYEVPTIWAEVDPDEPTLPRLFHIVGTGHDMPTQELTYIGTALFRGGALVWHLYGDWK